MNEFTWLGESDWIDSPLRKTQCTFSTSTLVALIMQYYSSWQQRAEAMKVGNQSKKSRGKQHQYAAVAIAVTVGAANSIVCAVRL